jgi:hypothetical protein
LNADEGASRPGIGQWDYFHRAGRTVEEVLEAAKSWRAELAGIERPWLIWNVDRDWCLVQQRLVESVGWTPVVGGDPKYERPPIIDGAVWIDFNRHLQLPMMYPHFVFEFTFAMGVPRLAFWHSDLLLKPDQMRLYADMFAGLPDGAMAAVQPDAGRKERWLKRWELRYWELLGCMTAGASLDNYKRGCGWWCSFSQHPNRQGRLEQARRSLYWWECGVGIRYWAKRYGGDVRLIPEHCVAAGHFTRINNTTYVGGPGDWRRDLKADLNRNFPIEEACKKMGLEKLLAGEPIALPSSRSRPGGDTPCKSSQSG